ncbi:MAG: hypothetical protein LKJ03_03460 [Enterococcaceae bacterium]|jgi:hypothetical protein|nr:hypothetical protein [Enterococcaceae bacterium]MCI1918993.1 hypothetical protein [Enterococcaceae bacterium]
MNDFKSYDDHELTRLGELVRALEQIDNRRTLLEVFFLTGMGASLLYLMITELSPFRFGRFLALLCGNLLLVFGGLIFCSKVFYRQRLSVLEKQLAAIDPALTSLDLNYLHQGLKDELLRRSFSLR